MTPLPWWVFLATLLGRTVGVPTRLLESIPRHNACVGVCRSLGRGEDIRECDEKLILQSDENFPAKRDLLGLCLTPCANLRDFQDQPIFDNPLCGFYRKSLTARNGCDCEGLSGDDDEDFQGYQIVNFPSFSNPTSRKIEKDTWLHELIRWELLLTEDYELIDTIVGENLENLLLDSDIEKDDASKKGIVENKEGRKKLQPRMDKAPSENVGASIDRRQTTTEAPVEPPVDWEMWCMAQCDNGQGGSACNCDIIP